MDLLITRQEMVLGRQRPTVHVVIGEGTLRQIAGNADIMRDQLRLPARISAEYPWVTVRVLPFTSGVHLGAVAGRGPPSCSSSTFRAAGVVHVDGPQGGVLLLDEPDVAAYLATHAQLRESALSPRQSQRFMHSIAYGDVAPERLRSCSRCPATHDRYESASRSRCARRPRRRQCT